LSLVFGFTVPASSVPAAFMGRDERRKIAEAEVERADHLRAIDPFGVIRQ
jgi:hypothetical protein